MKIINTKEIDGVFVPVGSITEKYDKCESIKPSIAARVPKPKHRRSVVRKTQNSPLEDFLKGVRVVVDNFGGL